MTTNDSSKQTAEQFVPDAAMNFAAYLIDHCEGETVTEESVQVWLGKMAKLPRYNPTVESALASMTRMFHAACADLGAINEALGLDPDDGGAEPIIEAISELKDSIATSASALARDEASVTKGRDVKQLADWLLTDPQTGEPLHFAGPLERDFLRMSRVKMESKSGGVWTLTAGLKEGYLTAAERMSNLERVAAEERQAAREPSIEQLTEMAYLLELVPRGEVVCVQFMEVLRKQYLAAMEASGV